MYRTALFPLAIVLLLPDAFAQEKLSGPTAVVSGHVYGSDTNAPLRMADVFLIPAKDIDKNAQDTGKGYQMVGSGRVEKTVLDGSFTISGVAPGDYYVIAVKNGYSSALDQLRMQHFDEWSDQEKRAKLLKVLPTATADSNQPVAVNITLTRGGSISGTVAYDDGSPADDVRLSVLYRFKDQWKPYPSDGEVFDPRSSSDDTGNYRLSGLPPGEYLVKADLQFIVTSHTPKTSPGNGPSFSTPRNFTHLLFYSGGKARPAEATGFQLGEGESRSGEDITIPLSRLHSIRGHLAAASDGHLLNAGGVALLHADDRSRVDSADLSRDETMFNFDFVPDGNYILQVEWAEDANYSKDARNQGPDLVKHTIKSYRYVEQPIQIISDQTNLVISVPSESQSRAAN
jgi:hypothetical protein